MTNTSSIPVSPSSHRALPKQSFASPVSSFDDNFHPASAIFNKFVSEANKAQYFITTSDINGTLFGVRQSCSFDHHELVLGSVMSEELVGTNGAGTCLASHHAVTVYDDEHFSHAYHGLACSSAPLISPFGEVVGALNISSLAKGSKSDHEWALRLTAGAADEIEAAIFRTTYARYHLLNLIHQTCPNTQQSNALIAVNDSGWIIGATTPVLQILGIQQRTLLIGQSLASLMGFSLEDLHRNRSLSLQDAFSNSAGWFVALQEYNPPVTRVTPKTGVEKTENSPLYQAAGKDSRLRRNADVCHRVIDKKINILLMGETGTGKEVWARAIHDSSDRRNRAFITLNCAAIPESLIESELFGYSSGTFTGGLKGGKTGKIEASSGGTLFLDEIGDMPLPLQARLLRVLAEGEVIPLGQLEPVKVDLNIICATHRNLLRAIGEGAFREDLYYRISGVNLTLLALRDRSDRIEVIKKVLDNVSEHCGVVIDEHAMSVLNKYYWPGNIRQLKNALSFAFNMSDGKTIRIIDLPDEVFAQADNASSPETIPSKKPIPSKKHIASSDKGAQEPGSGSCERQIMLKTLVENRWVVSRAAEALGISRSTLHRKIKMYGLNSD